jgi:uncharacterized membrane protein YccC
MSADLDTCVPREPLTSAAQHLLLEIDADAARVRARGQHERERVAVARAEIEHPRNALGEQLVHEYLESVDAMRDRVALAQVAQRPLRLGPTVDVA